MKLAALQLVSGPRLDDNLARASHWVAEAAAAGARFVALPEYFCLMGQKDEDKLDIAETLDNPGHIQRTLRDLARGHGIWLLGGTLPLRASAGKVTNTSLVYGPDGHLAARYDKVHLFSFNSGLGESYDEGRVQQAGHQPTVFDCEGLRTALSICYDLRFPELYRAMAPDLICAPSAFTHTTGKAHWELLLRARAVENLAYVIAPAQGGTHENGRRTWGHTLIVDPWGEVLGELAEGEGMVLATLETKRLAAVRKALPALSHRRL